MTLLVRKFVVSAMLSLALIAAAQADSGQRKFTTADGQTLILIPIVDMECADMDKMLARIDSTRYRENAPTPHSKADRPLFEYELTLAEANYNRCVIVRKRAMSGITIMRPKSSQ